MMNQKALFYAAGIGLLTLGRGAATAAETFLVHDGEPRAEIVVAAHPARMTKLAAQELRDHLEKITGARLTVTDAPSPATPVKIYVGVSSHTEALGLSTNGLAYGAFRMAAGPDWLALLGPDRDFEPVEPWGRERSRAEVQRVNRAWDEITDHNTSRNPFYSLYMHYNPDLDVWAFDDRGTLHAVHAFLHGLGVRWYFPGELGEVVPTQRSIALPAPMNRVVRPDYKVRDIGWWYMFLPVPEADARWRLRLGLHRGHDVVGITQRCHGMKFVHGRDETKQAHPEFYALWGGRRALDHKEPGAPCLSSEALFRKHVDYVRAVFDHFDEPMVSLDIVDGFGRGICECPLCRGKGTPERGYTGAMSDYVWGYIHRVAQEVYKTHPDRMVSGLSYGAYALPPQNIERMTPNLAVILMSPRKIMHDPAQWASFEHLLDTWRPKVTSGQLFSFENVMYNRSGGVPVYFPHRIARYLRRFKGIFEGELYSAYEHLPSKDFAWHPLAVTHLDLYVTSRLWWDADQDVDVLLDEYYTLFYGPARDAMKTFIEYCEANYPRMQLDVEPIDRARELFGAAHAAVSPESIYGQRIALVADYLKLIEPLREQLAREREGPLLRVPGRNADQVTVDGHLDDPFWEGVPAIALRERHTGDAPAAATSLRLAWGDNDSLYLGVRCNEPRMSRLMDTADGGMGIFTGDNLDILVETPIYGYYQIVVSPSGAVFDLSRRHGLNSLWSAGAKVATRQGPDYWSAEIQLPAAGIDAHDLDPNHGIAGARPRDDAPWYINLGRNRPRDGEEEFSVLAVTGDLPFHDRFIRAKLVVEKVAP